MLNFEIQKELIHSKKNRGILPVLVVLFLISYGMMSALVVEQGRTIDSQRGLIHDLFSDSAQLNAMKLKEILRQQAAQQATAKNNSQAPSAQMSQKDGVRKGAASRPQPPVMQKPPKPTADVADARRIPVTI